MHKLGLTVLLVVALGATTVAQNLETRRAGEAVIEKAIKAHGGAAMIDRHQAARTRIKATLNLAGVDSPALVETTVQLPGQFKNVFQVEMNGTKLTIVEVLNGDKGWMTFNGKPIPLDAAKVAAMKEAFYAEQAARLTPLFRDQNYRLSSLPESKVDGRPALGVKVVHAGRPDIYLYFDRANSLLVKSERRTKDPGKKEVLQEEIFRDYKEQKGVKRPTKFAVFRDGKKFMEGTVLDFTPLDKVDAKEFAKP